MQANVKWVDGDRFLATTEHGHGVLLDTTGEGGTAPTPMEMVLASLGSCSSVDVVSILKKARQEIVGCEVNITSERADSAPRVFTKINLHFVITGHDVAEKHVARAVSLSADKYCSVAKMLEGRVEITHSHEIISAK